MKNRLNNVFSPPAASDDVFLLASVGRDLLSDRLTQPSITALTGALGSAREIELSGQHVPTLGYVSRDYANVTTFIDNKRPYGVYETLRVYCDSTPDKESEESLTFFF